jgi:hypothetical protein
VPNFEEIWPSQKSGKIARQKRGVEYYYDAMENGPQLSGIGEKFGKCPPRRSFQKRPTHPGQLWRPWKSAIIYRNVTISNVTPFHNLFQNFDCPGQMIKHSLYYILGENLVTCRNYFSTYNSNVAERREVIISPIQLWKKSGRSVTEKMTNFCNLILDLLLFYI